MNTSKQTKLRLILLVAVVSLSAFAMAGTAAAGSVQTIVDGGQPADVPTQDTNVDQNLTSVDQLRINMSENSSDVAVRYDLSGTPIPQAIDDAGSDFDINVTKRTNGDFDGITGVDTEEEIAYFTGTADGLESGASHSGWLNVTVVFEGLDTSNIQTDTNLEYTVRASGAPEDTFSEAPLTQTGAAKNTDPFNLAFIEVVDGDGDTDVVTNISSAFDDTSSGDLDSDIDLNTETTINVGAGTYTPNNVDIVNDTITVQPAGDGDVVFGAEDVSAGDMFNVSDADGVTFQNVAFDFDEGTDAARALNISSAAGEVTVDGVTFRSPGDSNSGQDAITVSNASETLTVTGSTFDARPDETDTTTSNTTAVNVTDFGSSAGDGSLTLTVEQSTFDGYEKGTVGNLTAGIGSNEPAVDSVTLDTNDFANGNIYFNEIGTGSSTDLDTAFSSSTFDQYVVKRNDQGDIVNAVYGDLDTAQTQGDATSLGNSQTLEITGEHTDITDAIDIKDNSTTVTSPDESADIELGDGTDELINISVASTSGNAIKDITISDLTVTAATDGSDSFVINDTNSGDYINELVIENNEFSLEGTNTTGILINTTEIRNAEFVNNQFTRNDDATAYGGAINTEDVDFTDTGDQTQVTIADNEVLGAESGFNITANETNSDNLDVSIDDNTVQLAESASTGVNLTVTAANEVLVDGNSFISMDDDEVEEYGTDGTALNLTVTDAAQASDVEVELNEFTGIANESLTTGADRHSAGTAINLAAEADGNDDNSAVVLSDNDVQSSDIQIDITDMVGDNNGYSQGDILSLINSNTVEPDIRILDDQESADAIARDDGDSIAHGASYGTITAGVIDSDNSNNEAVNVGSGTYDETQIDMGKNIYVEATAGPEQTTLTTDTDEFFFNLSNGAEVSGFTFAPTADDDQKDILISSGSAVVDNNVFDGPDGENRRAIDVATDGNVAITDSTISGYDQGVNVDNSSRLIVVRNTITNNELGVSLADDANNNLDNTASINFNDIAGNTVGLEADDPEYTHVNATAVWWGDQSGPSGEDRPDDVNNEGLGNEVIDDFDDGMNVTPWLDDSISTLPESGYVVVTDERDRIATEDSDNKETADIAVATLDPDETSDAADNTVVTADPSGPINVVKEYGQDSVSAATPSVYSATADETGEYTLTARNGDGDVAQGSAVQTFVGDASGVDVTLDSETLIADDSATVNATLQVVDDEGNEVNKGDLDVEWLVDNSTNANITRESVDSTTDVNGEAELTLSAATSGFAIEVTGVESEETGASDTATFETVEPASTDFQLELTDDPTQIVQNESYSVTVEVTNDGTGAGTQDISYVLEDSAGLSTGIEAVEEGVELEPGESQQITFDVAAEDTDALETGTFTHAFESADNDLSADVEVVEEQTADFQVELDDGPTEVEQNQSYSATVNVSNVGSASGTQTVDYALENDSTGDAAVTASQEVTVDADATEQITFDVAASDTQSIAAGEYTHVVSTDGADDATLGVTITVEEDAPAYYTLKISNSIADRTAQTTTISTFSTYRQSGSTALLPRSVYRYTRTHTGGLR